MNANSGPVMITVKFRRNQRGPGVIGYITRDPLARQKIVFIDRIWLLGPGKREITPQPYEVWDCLVTNDSNLDNPHQGALHVVPVDPKERPLAYTLTDKRTLLIPAFIGLHFRDGLAGIKAAMPQLVAAIGSPAFVDQKRIDIRVHTDTPVFLETFLPTPPIRYSQDTLFSSVKGGRFLRRVLEVQDETKRVTADAFLTLKPGTTNRQLYLQAVAGSSFPRFPMCRPKPGQNEGLMQASINFWCRHAHVYHPTIMNTPFISTWKDVISQRCSTLEDSYDNS